MDKLSKIKCSNINNNFENNTVGQKIKMNKLSKIVQQCTRMKTNVIEENMIKQNETQRKEK